MTGQSVSHAQTAEEVNQKIQNASKEIEALDAEIRQYQSRISDTNQESQSLSNLIKELTLTRSKLLKEKQKNEAQITSTGLAIQTLDSNISSQQKSINIAEEAIKKMLYQMYQNDNASLVEQLLSQEDISEVSTTYNNILSVNKEIQSHITDLAHQQEVLKVTKTKKEEEKQNLSVLQKNLAQKEKAVQAAKTEKDTLLKETNNKEATYKKLLADRQKARDAFESDLRNYEAQLKFILNPSLLPSAGSGVLAWPLDTILITQQFGKTVSSKRLYVSGSHSGVDFRASIGTPVKSMGEGTVIGTGNTDDYCRGASFGKWVFIKYNNGLSSTYGHLSVIEAQAGQAVHTGDVVALSGNTGHSTGPHLHVTVYASQGAKVDTVPSISCSGKSFIMPIAATSAYLDPLLYLPKPSAVMWKGDAPRD